MANPIFTVSFNVEAKATPGDWVIFKNLVEDLRKRLRWGTHLGCDVLPPQEKPPTKWFHVKLLTNSGPVITLTIGRDNLYLDGYRVDQSGQWFEFKRQDPGHLIEGSTILPFEASYGSLENAAGQSRERIELGQPQLLNAIMYQLAGSGDQVLTADTVGRRTESVEVGQSQLTDAGLFGRGDQRARALIIVIQMICESVRYKYISKHIAENFSLGFVPSLRILALENGWEKLSKALQQNPFKLSSDDERKMEIRTVGDALEVLGMVLYYREDGKV